MNLALPLKFPNLRLSGNTDVIVMSLLVAALVPVGLLLTDVMNVLALVALPMVILMVMLFVRYPRLWLYTGAVVNYFWVSSGSGEEEITLKEYALVAFIIGGLWIWLFSMVFIKKRRIVRNVGDRVLLTAIFGASMTIVLAMVNDGSTVMNWLREYLLFYTMLYYLPWREHFTERKHIFTFLALTAGVFLVIGGTNLWKYVKAASNVLYAFEVWTSRKSLNTHIFLCATVLCSMGALYASTRKARLGMISLTAFFAVVVLVSFSRGFWISGIIGIMATLWLLDKRKLVLFALYGLIGGIIFIGVVQIVFPDKSVLILKVIQARLASSAQGTKDVSLLSRVYETQAIFSHISYYPFGGTGMGFAFMIFEPLKRNFIRVSFIHNGYLYVWMKLGLPFFFAFYGVWIYMMRKAYVLARNNSDVPLRRILAAGGFGGLVAFTLLNITSSIPEGRDGFYCLSVLYAAINLADSLNNPQ